MPTIVNFLLKDDDYDYLKDFVSKGKASAREIKRAEVLLMLHNQVTAKDIMRLLGIAQSNSWRIRELYLAKGPQEAIKDKFRPGRPRIFTPEQRAKITALACTQPPEGHGIWSLSLLAEHSVKLEFVETISKAQVGRILKKTK